MLANIIYLHEYFVKLKCLVTMYTIFRVTATKSICGLVCIKYICWQRKICVNIENKNFSLIKFVIQVNVNTSIQACLTSSLQTIHRVRLIQNDDNGRIVLILLETAEYLEHS